MILQWDFNPGLPGDNEVLKLYGNNLNWLYYQFLVKITKIWSPRQLKLFAWPIFGIIYQRSNFSMLCFTLSFISKHYFPETKNDIFSLIACFDCGNFWLRTWTSVAQIFSSGTENLVGYRKSHRVQKFLSYFKEKLGELACQKSFILQKPDLASIFASKSLTISWELAPYFTGPSCFEILSSISALIFAWKKTTTNIQVNCSFLKEGPQRDQGTKNSPTLNAKKKLRIFRLIAASERSSMWSGNNDFPCFNVVGERKFPLLQFGQGMTISPALTWSGNDNFLCFESKKELRIFSNQS